MFLVMAGLQCRGMRQKGRVALVFPDKVRYSFIAHERHYLPRPSSLDIARLSTPAVMLRGRKKAVRACISPNDDNGSEWLENASVHAHSRAAKTQVMFGTSAEVMF
jgi:hypothetical protein